MNPTSGDYKPSMDPHDGAGTSWVRSRARDGVETRHDRCQVGLTVAEQRCFDAMVAPMWSLRITRGRRSTVFGRDRTCLLFGVLGMVASVVSLGTLPLAVSFAGLVVALVAFVELSQHAAGSTWWPTVRRSLGLVVTVCELVVVGVIVACAFVVRAVKRTS